MDRQKLYCWLCAVGLLIALMMGLGAAPTFAADKPLFLSVQVNNAKVHPKPKSLSKAVLRLPIKARVQVLGVIGKWSKIKTGPPKSVIGYINTKSLEPRKKGLFGDTGGASEQERSMAARGYNPKVESKYRQNNPNLEAAFAKLEAIERDSVNKVNEAQAESFLAAGGVTPRE
jgi:hypothetical protein